MLSFDPGASVKGASDQNVIQGIVVDFLHKPYNSLEDPLDLWFHQLTPGAAVKPFTIGHSVGFGKAMACLLIVDAVIELWHAQVIGVPELKAIGKEYIALMAMKAMTDPGGDIEEQVNKTLAKKIRVSMRERPHVIQLWTAFLRTIQWKRSRGEKKSLSALLAQTIKYYNASTPTKQAITSDERDALMNLIGQSPTFCALLAKHWQNFPTSFSAVPVSLLAARSRENGKIRIEQQKVVPVAPGLSLLGVWGQVRPASRGILCCASGPIQGDRMEPPI